MLPLPRHHSLSNNRALLTFRINSLSNNKALLTFRISSRNSSKALLAFLNSKHQRLLRFSSSKALPRTPLHHLLQHHSLSNKDFPTSSNNNHQRLLQSNNKGSLTFSSNSNNLNSKVLPISNKDNSNRANRALLTFRGSPNSRRHKLLLQPNSSRDLLQTPLLRPLQHHSHKHSKVSRDSLSSNRDLQISSSKGSLSNSRDLQISSSKDSLKANSNSTNLLSLYSRTQASNNRSRRRDNSVPASSKDFLRSSRRRHSSNLDFLTTNASSKTLSLAKLLHNRNRISQ